MTRTAIAPSVGAASRTSRASARWMRFHFDPQCLPNCLWSGAHQRMHGRKHTALDRADQESQNSGAPQETPPVQAGNKIASNRIPPQLANERAKRKHLA